MELLLIMAVMLFAFALHYIYTMRNLPPGPLPLPLFGNMLQMDLLDPTQSYNRLSEKYGSVFTVWLGPCPIVVVTDYHMAKQLYKQHGDSLSTRGYNAAMDYMHGGDGDGEYGLSFNNGPKWREHKRFALHTLRNLGMGSNAMEKAIASDTERMLHLIKERIDSGQELDLQATLTMCVGSIISNMVFGVKYEYEDREFRRILMLADTMIPESLNPKNMSRYELPFFEDIPLLSWLIGLDKVKAAYVASQEIFNKLMEKKNGVTSLAEWKCYVDAYTEQRERYKAIGREDLSCLYNERQLRASAIDLFFPATHSVANTLHWAVGFMCASAASQAKVHAEIDSVLRGATVTMADKCKLPYVNACLMEVQRCANIVYMSNSHCITAAITINGYHVPKATQVEVAFQSMMHSGRYFDRPLEFVPERFYNTDARTNNADKVMPFGIGRRSCPGEQMARQELFMLFTSLMQHFSWRFASKQDEDNFGVDNAIMAFSRKPRHYKVAVEARM